MPQCYLDARIKQIYLDGDIKKAYVGSELFFSRSQMVTYYVDINETYSEEVDYGESCLSPKTFTPQKSGCVFVGWREDLQVPVYDEDVLETKIMGENPIFLYAVFKKSVTATFKRYYSSNAETKITKYLYYNNNNTQAPSFTAPSDITTGGGTNYNGWTWLGWSSIDNTSKDAKLAFKNGEPIKGLSGNDKLYYDATFYGLYSKSVKISYSGNGSTSGSTASSSKLAYCNAYNVNNILGAEFTLASCDFIKRGYTFTKWAKGNVNGTQSNAGSKVTLTTDTTFFALWKENSYTYILNKDANWSKTAATSGAGAQVQNQTTYWRIPKNGYITFNTKLDASKINKISLTYNHSRDENGKIQLKLYLPLVSGFTDENQNIVKSNEFADTGFVEVGLDSITTEFNIPSGLTGERYITIEVKDISNSEHSTLTLWQVAYK